MMSGAGTTYRGSQTGMSLLEIMIAVAICGMLAAIAIPNMISLRGRSMQAEAKTGLSAIARAEEAFFAEKETYTDDLVELGWAPIGAPRYIMGFTSDNNSSGMNDTAELGLTHLGPTNVFGIALTEADLPSSIVKKTTYTIGAAGNVDNDSNVDKWTLNDAGELDNVNPDID